MSEQVAKTDQKEPWPKGWWRFPLLPHIRRRPPDFQNTSQFCFSWMFFTVWSIDSLAFSVEVKLEDSFFIKSHLPYLIVMVSVPIFPVHFLQRFWRKSHQSRIGAYFQ